MSSTDMIAEALASSDSIQFFLGTYAGNKNGMALVDIDGQRQTLPAAGKVWPTLGDQVRLLRVNKVMAMLGPTKPAGVRVGRVAATGTPRCTVEFPPGSGVTQLMGFPKGATPVVNDVVLIDWESGGTVMEIVTAAAGFVAPTDPTPPPGVQQGRQIFATLDSGQYAKSGGGVQSNDVYASASTRSLWVYGTKIADTIPDGAVIRSVAINVAPLRDDGNSPRFGTHPHATMPGTAPVVSNLTSIAKPSGWVALPTSFGDLLKTGAAFGVGVDGAGYAIFRGTQKDGQSGALDITWTA